MILFRQPEARKLVCPALERAESWGEILLAAADPK